MMTISAPLRWYWRIYIPTAALVLLGFLAVSFGPSIEIMVAPVRGPHQTMTVVERTDTHLCWAWTFTKLRTVASDDIDASLEINGQPGGVTSVYEMESGRPWGLTRYAVAPKKDAYTLHWCASLPPYVRPEDSVRVRQVAYYPGLWHLWRLPIPFPDAISEGRL